MEVVKREVLPIRAPPDLVHVRQRTRAHCAELGFSLVDLTKLVTAASEIARNTLDYGGGGEVTLEQLRDGARAGLRLDFVDRGPGIEDVQRALSDGYSTGTGLGLGLGGARRLVNEFHLDSRPGEGTRVVLARWR